MVYATGDTVVHPRHGVATVHGVASKDVGKGSRSYLELVVAATSMRIMVPLDSVDEVGIRQLPTKSEAAAILAVLARQPEVSETWAERAASTAARIKSTELAQASMVIRDLTCHARRSGKPLSASENGVLKTCLESVSSELSLALELSLDDARALILEQVQLAQ